MGPEFANTEGRHVREERVISTATRSLGLRVFEGW